MTKNISKTKHVDDLRRRAEQIIPETLESLGEMSAPEIQKLVHELHVHKIELEMQNEALRKAQIEATEARQKYAALYDFSPVGYFTLDGKGRIIEANVTGASLLGAEKRSLAKQPFQHFIIPGYFSIFQSHLQKAHELRSKQTCKLKLTGKDGSLFDALIDTIVVIDGEGKFDHYRSSVTDITAITRAEEALREAEEGYRALASTADSMYLVDRECRYQFMNNAHLLRLGVSLEQVKGRSYGDFHSEEDLKQFAATIEAVFETGNSFQTEHKSRIGDSFFLRTFSPVKNLQGRITAVTVISKDITERKRAEEVLRLHSEILAHIVESVHLVRVDDGVIVYTNKRFDSVFGYDPGELVGKHVSIINAPGEKSPEAVANEIIRSLKQAGGVWNGEVHNIRKDGASFWCHANVSPFKHPEYGEVWISVNRDITGRKQAEELLRRTEENFRSSLDDSPLGVRIVTVEGETLYANRVILDIYGYDSIEEMRSTPVVKRYTPESFAEFQTRKEKRKRGGYSPSEYEISIVRKDGEVRRLHVFRKEVLWDGERQFQVLYNDITEREKQRKEIEHLASFPQLTPVMILEVGKDREVIFCNPSMQSVLDKMGIADPCIFIPKDIWELFNSTDTIIKSEYVRELQINDIIFLENIYFTPKFNSLRIYATDITEHNWAEEALRESQELYKTLAEKSMAGVYVVQDGKFRFINSNAASYAGYTKEELLNQKADLVVSPEDKEKLRQDARAMLLGEMSSPYEFRVITKQGETRWIMETVTSILYEGRRAILGNSMDITERKRAEEALRESEARYRTLFEDAADGIALADAETGRLVNCNQSLCRMVGWNKAELVGQAQSILHPHSAVIEGFSQTFRQHQTGDTETAVEDCLLSKSGKLIPVEIRAARIEINGRGFLIGIFRDITERKEAEESLRESEEKYRALVETTDTGFVIIDENGTVLDANENYIRMTGHKALDEIRNRSITEWTSRHDLERNEQAVRECFDQGFIRDLEISYVNKKGENTPVDINASVVETKEGRKIVSLCRDITKRKQAEQAIKSSHQQLRALAGRLQSAREDQRKQIAREIHDELGGALTGLKIDLSLLVRSAPKSRDKPKRDLFLSKIREMTKLIDETIGTVRRVVTELRPSILDDFGLLEALEWQIQEFEKRTGIKCKFVSIMAYVSLDEERSTAVFRIFQEALTNVARHANATKVTATLYKEADGLVLKVEDNGKGISEYDIHNPKSVGLIGMRERALFLGGTVNFSGEPSKGTTVSLQFPLGA